MKRSTILLLVVLCSASGPPLARGGEPVSLNAAELDHVSAGGVTVQIDQAKEVSIATLGDVEVRVPGASGPEGIKVRVGPDGGFKLIGIDGLKVTIDANDDFAAILRKLEKVHVEYRLETVTGTAEGAVLVPGVGWSFLRSNGP